MGRYLDILRATEIGRSVLRSVVIGRGKKTSYSNGLLDRSYKSYVVASTLLDRVEQPARSTDEQAKKFQQQPRTYDLYDRSRIFPWCDVV
jgi:hypothetical protein